MNLIDKFKEEAKAKKRTIVFPEGEDERIIKAASSLLEEGIVRPVVLGNEEKINKIAEEKKVDMGGISIIEPSASSDLKRYAQLYQEKREDISQGMALRLLKRPLLFAATMVASGDADGMVAGVANPTASVIQAAGLAIGYEKGISIPSSFFIMVLPQAGGEGRILIYADAAINIDPTSEQLAEIAVATARSTERLLKMEPRLAFLSFSTKGSASHSFTEKVTVALERAKEKAPEILMDGELQLDAALVPEVAARKAKGSKVAGKANVLIFPDLDAANIAYKITQYLAGAEAYGPIFQGFRKPVNDLSRGASVEDIIGVAAITAVQTD